MDPVTDLRGVSILPIRLLFFFDKRKGADPFTDLRGVAMLQDKIFFKKKKGGRVRHGLARPGYAVDKITQLLIFLYI